MTQIQYNHAGPGCWAITLFCLLLLTAQHSAKPLEVFILDFVSDRRQRGEL